MVEKELERLWLVLQRYLDVHESESLKRKFLGYVRYDPLTHEVVHRKRGCFEFFAVDDVCDAVRDWSIDNIGCDSNAYGGQGWKQITERLFQQLRRSKKSLEQESLEEHHEHYKIWGWDHPGDDYLLGCIRKGEPTELQRHVFGEIRKLRESLVARMSEEERDHSAMRKFEEKDAARTLIVREQVEELRRQGKIPVPKSFEEIQSERAKNEEVRVEPGYMEIRRTHTDFASFGDAT